MKRLMTFCLRSRCFPDFGLRSVRSEGISRRRTQLVRNRSYSPATGNHQRNHDRPGRSVYLKGTVAGNVAGDFLYGV